MTKTKIPPNKLIKAVKLGTTLEIPKASLELPLLVLPFCLELPECPFEVAKTSVSTVAVLI